MSRLEARVAGDAIETAGWSVSWEDRAAGIVRLRRSEESHLVVVRAGRGPTTINVAGPAPG